MKKREFLKQAGIISAGVIISPMMACKPKQVTAASETAMDAIVPVSPAPLTEFTLPALGFATNALEPSIDVMTMEIHHDKHHAAYVNNLNKALGGMPFHESGYTLEEICALVMEGDTAVRNNGGGHYNHTQFWKWIAPGGSAMDGELMKALKAQFGSFEEFNKQFTEAAKNRFGSGWAWLSVDADKKLFISSTPNQDNPLMKYVVEKPGTPILGIDVWEHAYYLNYQNKRADYITAFMSIVNWNAVGKMYAVAMK